MLRDQIFQIKKMFPLIHLHLHHLHTVIPVLHLPVPENQFPVNKDNFMFIKVNIEESLEYVELPDMPLNEELDPLAMINYTSQHSRIWYQFWIFRANSHSEYTDSKIMTMED